MKQTVFDINVDSLTMEEFLTTIDCVIKERRICHVLGLNADKIVEGQTNKQLFNIIQCADIIHADGISIIAAAKFLGINIPERVAGIDLMERLLYIAEKKKYTVYFLGAKSVTLEKMIKNFSKQFPNLEIVGFRNGYFEIEYYTEITRELKRLHPQLVFVGITSPKKEYVIDYFIENGIRSVFIGVGGSFDVFSGEVKRAPLWMQRCHLEWFFRVTQEPKRLLKRYLVGNFKFLKILLLEKLK